MNTLFSFEFSSHFIINISFLLILLRGVYFRHSPNRESLLGFFMFGNGVFLVTFLLHNVDMSMGFAFGLFAVFSMLRYRTESLPIRDMTYLFTVIVMALISSVGKLPTFELIILDVVVCALAAFAETSLLAPRIMEKKILYEHIENIRPEHYDLLLEDLRLRTGLHISKIEVEDLDYLRDTARLRIFYTQPSPPEATSEG